MNAVVMGNVIMVSIVHIVQISSNKDILLILKTAVIWLKFCRYGIKHYPINQSSYVKEGISDGNKWKIEIYLTLY